MRLVRRDGPASAGLEDPPDPPGQQLRPSEVLHLLDGLTEEQARRRLVPSKTSLLALVKHATFVEQVWFPVSLAGRSREEVVCPADADESFDLTDEDTIPSVTAAYRAAAEESRRIAATYALDDLALHNRRGPLTVRWILVHMVEELARHAGHGDILRELILTAPTDQPPATP